MSGNIIIYHGSTLPIEQPKILTAQRTLDFGSGFYATKNYDQAVEWAKKVCFRKKSGTPVVSVYEFDLDDAITSLRVLQFKDEPDYDWLDFVYDCRRGKQDLFSYDMVFGPMANDSVYATFALYESGVLSREETIKRLKVRRLYNQILFHTEESLEYCSFVESKEV